MNTPLVDLLQQLEDLTIAKEALEAELAELQTRYADLQRASAAYATEMTQVFNLLQTMKGNYV